MKIIYYASIAFLIIAPDLLPQFKSSEIKNLPDGIEVKIKFDKEPYILKKENEKEFIEYTNALDEGKPGAPVLPSKTFFVAIPPFSEVDLHLNNKKKSVISDVNIQTNPLTERKDELLTYKNTDPYPEYFVSDEYPSEDVLITGYTWIREYYCAVIQINTHKYNWKKKQIRELKEADLVVNFKSVKPFNINTEIKSEFDKSLNKIILNYDYADEYRSYHPLNSDTTDDWINYDNEYVKIAISENGIYKITHNDLISYGINPSVINPKTVKIFFEGKQIPVFISGENDSSFDQGDYIEFWGEKNYGSSDYKQIVSIGEDYKNYMDRYNDTNFVWISWEDENGLRADSIDNFIPGLTDTVASHLVRLHLEKDVRLWYYDAEVPRVQFPFWQENKTWTWHFLGNGGNISFNFNAIDFLPNTNVNVNVRMISNATNQLFINNHRFGLSLNSASPQDTIVFNYKQTVNFNENYSSNQLTNGNNIVRVFGMQNDSLRFHQALIDWLDIEFYRRSKAVNDSLMITIPDSVSFSEKVITVTSISDTSNVYLYKIKPQFKRITAYNFLSGSLTFTDTVSGGDKYLVINEGYKKSPRFVAKKQFVNLRSNSRIADYIILSNRELEESVSQYHSFIETNYQLNVETIYINDIYDEFSFGLEKAEAVRDFLFTAYQNWQPPKPSFLVIIGDANYDYKKVVIPPTNIFRKNLVPSFGNPVSDSWYTMWDSSNLNIPQMFVSRIPAEKNEEVLFYMEKHQTYINRQYDSWNKNYLFFSGGDVNSPTQLTQIRNANTNLLNQLVKPAPVGGSGIHFYKTISPSTNFGPYSLSEINEAISNGGLFISYIGHSGTKTWDNGILSPEDLRNSYADRNPLVSDFGCSTGKFAEPDVDAFGELFLMENPIGQAIHYLGNSSLGFLSTSLRFPHHFYSKLLTDTIASVGEAHFLAKMVQFNESGFTDVNRVFNYCNILFGDPLIRFKTPLKPNLNIKESSFLLVGNNPSDITDSVKVAVEILNSGRVMDDSVKIAIISRWFNEIILQSELTIPLPLFRDSITITIPVAGRVGQHNLEVSLDAENSVDEIYENDNSASFTFTVYSTSLRPIETEKFYNTNRSFVRVLNPSIINTASNEARLSIADNDNFNNANEIDREMDSVFTSFNLNSLTNNKRYWWRVKINDASQEWSDVYSFKPANKNFTWHIDDSFNSEDLIYSNIIYDSLQKKWRLSDYVNVLEVLSAGSDDGEFGSMFYNGEELLPNTFYWGIGTAEIDTTTLRPSNFRYFLFSTAGNTAELMKAYLDSLPQGKVVAMTICADGAQSVLGFGGGTEIRRTIEEFGSIYIDSVRYRDSWCIIGKKGAPPGTVPESFKRRFFGIAEISISNTINNDSGYVMFPSVQKSFNWLNIEKEDSIVSGSSINYIPIGIKQNGEADTLDALAFSGSLSSLSHIDASVYPSLKILAGFYANEFRESPYLSTLGINYKTLPELAINYQVVNISPDTVFAGENVNLNFAVFNAGETPADSFKIKVELIKSNNERELINNLLVDEIDSLGKKYFELQLNTLNYIGNNNFAITVDSENKVTEIFEDNNFFQIPFFVKPDTSVPTLNVTFDGIDIIDGDYVSDNPEIKIELIDPSVLPLNDTSSVSLYLNEEEIYFANNPEIQYQFSPTNPKMIVTFKPDLTTGEYTLRVLGKNAAGSVADSAGLEKYFLVNENSEILDVYNYPNPSRGETYFTFKLTQIPDELKIKIYTVAGRLIKEMRKTSSELKHDFNTIYWDGKDNDKDPVANGVYLYKVIISKDGKNQDVTEKLAIVR